MTRVKPGLSEVNQRIQIIVLGLVLLATFLPFSPSLKHSFFRLDDDGHVGENASIRGLDGAHLKAMFTRRQLKIYVPLTYLSYALEYKFFADQPFIYHLDNLLLHLGVTALVFLLGRRWGLSLWAAAMGSLLFGIHPMHVESVAWITERKDVLYSLFYLLALYHYQNYIEGRKAQEEFGTESGISGSQQQGRAATQSHWRVKTMTAYFCTIGFALLSILAKPMALSLPLIFFVCDWFQGRRCDKTLFLEKIPHFLIVIPIAAMTYLLHARVPGRAPIEGVLVWIWTLTFYIKTFFFPAVLFPAWVLPRPVSVFEPTYSLAVAIFLVMVLSLYVYRKERWFIFAFLYFFFSIFFLLRYDDLWDANIVADRFMYLPCLGLCLWLGFSAERALRWVWRRPLVWRVGTASLCMIIMLSLFAKTYFQTKLWGDDFQLWNDGIKHFPKSFFAFHSRGNIYLDQKDYDSAISDFSQAIRLRPDYASAYSNRGLAYYNLGNKTLALEDFNKSLGLNASQDFVYVNRGLVYTDIGKYDLAIQDLNEAIKLNPDNAYAYNNRGRLYFTERQYDLALTDFNKALELKKDLVKAYVSRGNVFLVKKMTGEALRDYNKALQYDPNYAGAYYNRSLLYYSQKDFALAWEDAQKAKILGFAISAEYLQNISRIVDRASSSGAEGQAPQEGLGK
jgi:protein O-mannosyl-transferase